MNSGSVSTQASSFRDLREICKRAHIVMLDHQRRDDATGFQQNGDTGKRVHGILGWDKLAPESMAMYQNARAQFRLAAKPAAEARMWMIAGIAGGIQPWWHHIGAFHEDRRAYRTAEPVMQWHKANQAYLVNRRPVASVGLLWSQRNTDFYGRDRAADLVDAPYQGFAQALIRARIPYLPIHADDLDREAPALSVVVLANVGALSDSQCASIRRFVERGGSLVATGESSRYDEAGELRPDFALADLLRAHTPRQAAMRRADNTTIHTYLRLHESGARHPVLRGFEETAILAFGGTLEPLTVETNASVLLTFIPEFPVFPPETSWMRETDSKIPGLIVSEAAGGGRVAYLPADLDRRYFRELLPDHGNLLANLVRWAANDRIPLTVEGAGLIDCHLYRQDARLILHLVNLTSSGTWRSPIDELIPVGPLSVRVRLPEGLRARSAQALVSSGRLPLAVRQGWAEFEVKSIPDHELLVLS